MLHWAASPGLVRQSLAVTLQKPLFVAELRCAARAAWLPCRRLPPPLLACLPPGGAAPPISGY